MVGQQFKNHLQSDRVNVLWKTLTVGKDVELVVQVVTTDTEDASTIDFTAAGENSLALLKIENTPGAALPNTGGPGTCMIYLSGMALICLATAGLVMKRRQKAA